MLRGSEQKVPSFVRAHPRSDKLGPSTAPSVSLSYRLQSTLERRTGIARALGFCGWALAGGTALFAIWELGNCSVLIGNAPLLPTAIRETSPAILFRPAGEGPDAAGGCTQARIDRFTGQTTTTDCHTWVRGRETITALASDHLLPP